MKTKNRSPYAKSLELKQYRHRVERDKRSSFDDWVEDALEDYWRNRNAEMDKAQKKENHPEGGNHPGRDDHLGTSREVVEKGESK